MLRIPAVVAAGVAVLLVASACTDDKPDPNYSSVSTSPTPSISPTPSDSASPTDIPATGPNVGAGEVPPTEPAQASVNSAEGAQAFESYYIRLIDWAYATNSPGILTRAYAMGCENCDNFVSNLSAQVADGSSVRGSRISIKQLGLVENDGRSGAGFAISVEIDATAIQILDAQGQVTSEGPASTITLTNWLAFVDGSWVIVDQGKA